MGWYDAFKGDVARVNVAGMTSNAGSAAKNFGDAFKDISKSILEVDAQRKKEAVASAEIKKSAAQATLAKTKNTQANLDNNEINRLREVKKLDDAFKKDFSTTNDVAYQKSLLEFEKPDGVFDSKVSNNAFEYANKKIAADELKAQVLFNDKAVERSATGGYADMKSFVASEPTLVKNADGVTMAKIDKYYSDKNNSLKDIKQATALAKMQAKITKASGKNSAFKYTELTDAKIAAQVKTAMGMDAPDFSFTDASKVSYQDAVAGSAKISKDYNLEPSLAIHVYQNPDLYELTADGKVLVKKQKEKTHVKKSSSWKDYQ